MDGCEGDGVVVIEIGFVEQLSSDLTGWARLSADGVHRYRLARALGGNELLVEAPHRRPRRPLCAVSPAQLALSGTAVRVGARRAVFVLLNPSTADAFKPDPTVRECIKRATRLGADVLEIVNLFSMRTPYPRDLRAAEPQSRGADVDNNRAIMDACRGAEWVIAAWGNDGHLADRDLSVMTMLRSNKIALGCFGTTSDGSPKHPLARGKHRIPANRHLTPWPE